MSVPVLAALVGLLLVGYLLRQPERNRPPRIQLTQLTSQAGIDSFPSLSPDGDQLI